VGEAQEIKRFWFSFSALRSADCRETAKFYQPGLFLMQFQSELVKTDPQIPQK
jgi:hypothetical protein